MKNPAGIIFCSLQDLQNYQFEVEHITWLMQFHDPESDPEMEQEERELVILQQGNQDMGEEQR